MSVSVIIPVLEDRAAVRQNDSDLGDAEEVIVVDASERDPVQSGDLPAGVRLVRCGTAGRAGQMNLGSGLARGEALLFLHADTRLPEGAIKAVRHALDDPAVSGGGFARKFDSPSRLLRWTCRLAAWRGCRLGWFLGDQAIYARRTDFEEAGGFPPLGAFEDLEFCRRLKRRGRLRCLTPPVISSARRFERDGPLWRTLKDGALTAAYLAGGRKSFEVIRKAK